MRPHGAVVIAARVVVDRARREGADSPTREKVRSHEPSRDRAGTRRGEDAAPQAVPGIGRDRLDALLAAVERLGDEALAWDPEVAIESSLELRGSRFQLGSPARHAHQRAVE